MGESSTIKFSECELVIDNSQIPKLDIFENLKETYICEYEDIIYKVDCEIINDMLWIYVKYGSKTPYTNIVLDIKSQKDIPNPRMQDELELKNQLFCIYQPKNAVLYISNYNKNTFLATFLKDHFNKNFSIKKYFIDPESFAKEIKSLESIKFTSAKNLFNSDIFDEVADVCGYGMPVSFILEAKYKGASSNLNLIKNTLKTLINRKENGEIDKLICVGKDDKNIEKIFNLNTFIKKISIKSKKDKNGMFIPDIIKNSILEKLNEI
ncbi:hypothetical protein [Campylobacter ureolyticus]|uniref:hypothetical protein n=1 Tax=Campylobacter ureolyticus TaxID=827 RepID=UPI0022B48CEB|nr:hypothetical protein [Campylobacter ureolyticus]MCZ6103884.1 hypothetical protein [Campylobacter ureolyticus]MCZ6172960.1 hypothetical protein [Campylobacter ureolyticus]MDU4981754.1 hypothetical protein [Campylobacter ureolyticus]